MKRLAISCVIATAVVGCYAPHTGRREQTTVSDDAAAVLATVLVSPTAATPPTQPEFEKHYNAAIDFYKKGSYPEAIAEFEAAYAVDPQPLLIFNIAQAYRKAGRLEQALAKYKEYLDKDPSAQKDQVAELIKQVEHDLKKQHKGHH